MKRLSRFAALAISALMLIGVMSVVTVTREEVRIPESVQDFAQMCGK
ncbi:MAG: hypothetical protein NC122_08215 [Faecalibacterium sp.]|nr:hypothetical protein [Ruminococcus sp.]MCM1392449.1 hypothetical protein [Ruminococcus sp.]MCM1486178.1 hypothetical protein [Faecalibacterium sp.]